MTNYRDIAKLANVSIATISHVINNTRYAEPLTRQRVLDAIETLKYKPNLYARGLAIGKTNTVGLVISDITNPFYPELVQGTEKAALENGYNIFLCNIDYNTKIGLKSIGALISKKIDGIILASSQIDDLVISEIVDYGINFVMVDWGESDIKADSIKFDYWKGLKEAVDYLVQMKHKKIFFISGPKQHKTSTIRINDFKNAALQNKDVYYEIIEGDHKLEGGYNAAKNILKGRIIPTAIICSNDLTAIGAMQSFIDSGLSIPSDISIIGLDNIKLTEIIKPHLTTIGLERKKIGATLLEILLKRINDKNLPIQKVTFTTSLIKRESATVCRDDIK